MAIAPNYLNFRGDSSVYTHRPTGDTFAITVDLDLEGRIWHWDANGDPVGVGYRYLNTMAGGLFEMPFVDNGHYYPTLGVDPDGYIHIAANMRSNAMKVAKSNAPLSISSGFTSEIASLGSVPNWGYTYPNYANYADDTLLFTLRRRQLSPEQHYGRQHMYIKEAGEEWVDLGSYAQGDAVNANQPYLTPPNIHPVDDVLRMAGVWSLYSGGVPATNRVEPYYFQSSDRGLTYQNVLDEDVTVPLIYVNRAEVLTGQEPGGEFNDPASVTLDFLGRPTFTMRDILGAADRQTWTGPGLTNWAVSNPGVQTGLNYNHIVFSWRNNHWYLAPGLDSRPTFADRFGNTTGMGKCKTGEYYLTMSLDQGALKDNILRTVVFDSDGETALLREFGHGYKYGVPA